VFAGMLGRSLEESGVICYCVLFRSRVSVCWDARTAGR